MPRSIVLHPLLCVCVFCKFCAWSGQAVPSPPHALTHTHTHTRAFVVPFPQRLLFACLRFSPPFSSQAKSFTATHTLSLYSVGADVSLALRCCLFTLVFGCCLPLLWLRQNWPLCADWNLSVCVCVCVCVCEKEPYPSLALSLSDSAAVARLCR